LGGLRARWIRFIIGGGANTAFTYGLYLVLAKILEYQWAYLLSYAIGIVFAYWLNAVLVFKVELSWGGFLSYPLVYIIQYVVSALMLGGLVELLEINKFVAPLVVVVTMLPLTYLMNWLVLRRENPVGGSRS